MDGHLRDLVYWIFEGVSRPDCRYPTSGTFGRTGFEIRGKERALRGRWVLTSSAAPEAEA
jgi:hypothetical protein